MNFNKVDEHLIDEYSLKVKTLKNIYVFVICLEYIILRNTFRKQKYQM